MAGPIYADLNTAAPELKRELAALVGGAGARFADVALLGPVPARGLAHAGARLRRRRARRSPPRSGRWGCRSRSSPTSPGDAAALKLLRSVFMKGLAAAAIESLEAAEAAGHAEWLEAEIADVIGEPLLDRLLEGSRAHAARRVDEMEAAREPCCSSSGSSRGSRPRARPARRLSRREALRSRRWLTPPRSCPSDRARTLVRGAYDLHVHVAPDVPARRIDDVTLAHRCAEVGLAGFGLKSHYTSTAERAQIVSGARPGRRRRSGR